LHGLLDDRLNAAPLVPIYFVQADVVFAIACVAELGHIEGKLSIRIQERISSAGKPKLGVREKTGIDSG
jgi:hypothetical protein